MALDCNLHTLVFVVVIIPPKSVDELNLLVLNEDGHLLANGQERINDIDSFLKPWLVGPNIRVRFDCTLVHPKTAATIHRHLHSRGYYDVAYNAMAYTFMTPDVLYDCAKDDPFELARCFAAHLIDTTDGWCPIPDRTTVYLVCAHTESSGLTIAAGTQCQGVQIAVHAHYSSDICETLLPWFSKQSHYRLVFVSNYATEYAWNSVNKVLAKHGYTLKGLPVEKMPDPGKKIGRFLLADVDKPGFIFARNILELFIIDKRCRK